VPAGFRDDLERLPDIGGETFFQEMVDHRNHAVERRAVFVAHGRKKIGFRLVGGARLVARPPQFLRADNNFLLNREAAIEQPNDIAGQEKQAIIRAHGKKPRSLVR
jgi:hypothetical protein